MILTVILTALTLTGENTRNTKNTNMENTRNINDKEIHRDKFIKLLDVKLDTILVYYDALGPGPSSMRC